MSDGRPTVWVFGDQCNRQIASLADRQPATAASCSSRARRSWRRSGGTCSARTSCSSTMAHFAAELRDRGFEVVEPRTHTRRRPARARRPSHATTCAAMAPLSWDGRALLERLGVEIVENDQFLCSYQDFAEWAGEHRRFKLEDFYRWQRRRSACLMDAGGPAGGRWNFDHDNREPPPKDGAHLARAATTRARRHRPRRARPICPSTVWGAPPDGTWPSRAPQALTPARRRSSPTGSHRSVRTRTPCSRRAGSSRTRC